MHINQEDDKLDVQHIESNQLDADAQRLQDLGYKQEFKREISLFVQAGFAFSTMAVLPSWYDQSLKKRRLKELRRLFVGWWDLAQVLVQVDPLPCSGDGLLFHPLLCVLHYQWRKSYLRIL